MRRMLRIDVRVVVGGVSVHLSLGKFVFLAFMVTIMERMMFRIGRKINNESIC